MKKSLMSLLMLLVLSGSVYSQISMSKGIKGGVNFATWGGNDAKGPNGESPTVATNFNAGAFLRIDFSLLPVSIQPEVLYTVKGAKFSGTFVILGQPYAYTSTAKFAYVEVPVLLKLNIPLAPGMPVKPVIFAGPAASFKVSAKVTTESGGQSSDSDVQDVKSTDFGVIVGAGVDINLVAVSLTVDARYNLGLTTTDASSANADVKNRVISVNVGIGL